MFLPKMTDLGLLDGGGDNLNDRYWWSRKYQTKVCRTPVGFENKEKSHVDQMFEKRHYSTLNFWFGIFPDGKMKIASILGSSLK